MAKIQLRRADLVRSPSNGKIQFTENLVHPTRTRHGQPAFLKAPIGEEG